MRGMADITGAAAGLEFGVYLPQVSLSFEQMLGRALECERLGYDALWLYDHLYAPGVPGQPSLEAWTLATALLARTEYVRTWLLGAAQCQCPSLNDCPLFDEAS